MLEFVRPVRLQVERTDLGDVVQQSVTMAESKARRGKVTVAVHVESGLPMIEADHNQLSQVFTNLLANAFEALVGSGHISDFGGRRRNRSRPPPWLASSRPCRPSWSTLSTMGRACRRM